MNTSSHSLNVDDRLAWNQAYDRLKSYLDTFGLSDHPHVSLLGLKILDRARVIYENEPSKDPTGLVMDQTQKELLEWLAANLDQQDVASSQIFSSGCIALLLSRMGQTYPSAFLAPLPEDLRQSLRQPLLVTGPNLDISSMSSRHIDYGPMLHLARHTWHRWNSREILIALVFWAGIYLVFYWWLSEVL